MMVMVLYTPLSFSPICTGMADGFVNTARDAQNRYLIPPSSTANVIYSYIWVIAIELMSVELKW